MTQQLAKIQAITKSHPVPSQSKLEHRMRGLDRMLRFYKEKAPVAPEKQGELFLGFVASLEYAMTIIAMYRKITRQVAELAGEADETRTNSEG